MDLAWATSFLFMTIIARSSGNKLYQSQNLVNNLILCTSSVVIDAPEFNFIDSKTSDARFCHFEATHQMLKNENARLLR